MHATAKACTPDDLAADDFVIEDDDVLMDSEWDELRRTHFIRKRRWWRIVDAEAGNRILVEISARRGERARALIEDSKWDGSAAGLEGANSVEPDPGCLYLTKAFHRDFLVPVHISTCYNHAYNHAADRL